MRPSRGSRWIVVLLGIGILMALVPVQESIHKGRPAVFDPDRKMKPAGAMELGPTPALIASLGGFRTVAADLLWIRLERVWDTGNWWALLPLLESVTQLDPHFVLAWQVYGWHCAYNMNAEAETVIDKRYWLQRGMEVLQRAVDVNPDSWEMLFELGWTHFDRAHEPYRAAEYFNQADEMLGSRSYVTRMTYRVYEHIMDFEKLFPAMERALKRHTDDAVHQKTVKRDIDWWTEHWNDPREHRRQIVMENTKRQQRGAPGVIPFWLYPDDPYYVICPYDGMPAPKGSTTCEYCRRPLPQSQPTAEATPAGG